jgi:hypothetical protein
MVPQLALCSIITAAHLALPIAITLACPVRYTWCDMSVAHNWSQLQRPRLLHICHNQWLLSYQNCGKAVFSGISTCGTTCCTLQKESKHEASIRAAKSLDYSQAPFVMAEGDSQVRTVVVMVAEQVTPTTSPVFCTNTSPVV